MPPFAQTETIDPERRERHLPPAELIAAQVRLALDEDLGRGDLTAALIPADQRSQGEVVARDEAILCGGAWFETVFRLLDPRIEIRWTAGDGQSVAAGQTLCRLAGPSRALLTGERTALNYLQTLSGTATRVRRYVEALAGLPVRLLDTRKTLPGLRVQQKYAVLCGGGHNHRLGLFDAILIKENHIRAAGSITAALAAARALPYQVPIEIEVESLTDLEEALAAGAPRVLLDNFTLPQLRQAVNLNAGRARLEASGGVTLASIRAIAESGVDDISVGDLTKDVTAVDLSLRFL
ncbi:carboxylating nicotinate-nucleotide diphosphorylase [Thioalkalicoccus limnaeus]|uniref:nicotinate-nucleotide diphosphorylase (carboxylating) n=1 Tax=Thioalkalicoccus limnaeus TaxID=120681 RepID=A0ABV4BBR6_9GAMM